MRTGSNLALGGTRCPRPYSESAAWRPTSRNVSTPLLAPNLGVPYHTCVAVDALPTPVVGSLRRVDSVRIEVIGGRVVATARGIAHRLPCEARISTAHAAALVEAGVRVELCV